MAEQDKAKIAEELQKSVWKEKRKRQKESGKKTMSITEMGALLGLKKTESYWLANKHFFKLVYLRDRARVDIESFEKWYANQVTYHKVDGEPPGEDLRQSSLSARDISILLGISEARAYDVINEQNLPIITVDYRMRVPREAFERWYQHQRHYRTVADQKQEAFIEAATISMPEMARLLGVSRSTVYSILKSKKYGGQFEIRILGDQKRITKESFQRWYENQDRYWVESDRAKFTKYMKEQVNGDIRHAGNDKYYTLDEIHVIFGCNRKTLYSWIQKNYFPAVKVGWSYRIPRKEFNAWYESKTRRRKE